MIIFLCNMKILIASCERRGWSGGAEQFTLLANGLRERKHIVHTVCVSGSSLEARMKRDGFETKSLPMWNDVDIYSAVKLAHYCEQNSFDIIHAMHSRGHSVALLSAYLLKNIPLIITRRVSFQIKDNPYTRFKYRNVRVNKFICVSEAVKRELTKFHVPEEKIEVIYSGVDTTRFKPTDKNFLLRKNLGIPTDLPLIGSIANFSKWKGQRIFLESAKLVKEKKLNVHFLLAGNGNDTEPVTSWVEEFGLRDIVTLHGFVDNVPSFMSALDIFVSPSVGAEGLSGTLREALAMGLPVIATDVGGNKELVKNMKTGLLVPPSNPGAIANAIDFLIKNRDRAFSMAESGREYVIQNLSADKMVERTEKVYMDCLRVTNTKSLPRY